MKGKASSAPTNHANYANENRGRDKPPGQWNTQSVVCPKALLTAALWLGGAVTYEASAQDAVVLDEIVAKVNNEIITLTDLNKELNSLRAALRDEFRNPETLEREFEARKREVLRTMIENKMMLQKADELGLAANVDVEVAAALEEMRKQSGIPNMDVFEQILRQRGSSLAEYRDWIRKKIIIDSLIGQFVYSKLTLLTAEIEAFYKENIQLFTEPAEVELAEILLLTEGKDKNQVRSRAEEALARLKSGVAFEETARQYSEGPTASRGGGIGAFRRGSIAPALEKVVFELGKGQTSGIIETEYGLQIIKVADKKEATAKSLEDVRPLIQRELYQRKARPEMEEFMEDLRSQSYVYVAPKYREMFDLAGVL